MIYIISGVPLTIGLIAALTALYLIEGKLLNDTDYTEILLNKGV